MRKANIFQQMDPFKRTVGGSAEMKKGCLKAIGDNKTKVRVSFPETRGLCRTMSKCTNLTLRP